MEKCSIVWWVCISTEKFWEVYHNPTTVESKLVHNWTAYNKHNIKNKVTYFPLTLRVFSHGTLFHFINMDSREVEFYWFWCHNWPTAWQFSISLHLKPSYMLLTSFSSECYYIPDVSSFFLFRNSILCCAATTNFCLRVPKKIAYGANKKSKYLCVFSLHEWFFHSYLTFQFVCPVSVRMLTLNVVFVVKMEHFSKCPMFMLFWMTRQTSLTFISNSCCPTVFIL